MLANSQYMQLAIDHIVFASLGIVSINAHFLHKHFLDLKIIGKEFPDLL